MSKVAVVLTFQTTSRFINNSIKMRSKESVERITKIVCDYFKIEKKHIIRHDRNKEIAYIRRVLFYLVRTNTINTYAEIGYFFNRNHATVIYSHNTIRNEINHHLHVRKDIENLKELIG